ncbi:Lrp/AsnC family transcriptional regulator [Arthrobacter gyeryongensis]
MSIPYGLRPAWGMGDTFIFMAALTDLDRQLLSALREDGRASVASLARKLGVARATVNSRLERLVSSGTIVGFTARVRDEVDPLAIRAIALIAVEGRSADKVIRQLRGLPEIWALHTTNGGWDLVAELRTESLSDFDQVLGRIRGIEGIVNSETSLLLSSVLR